MHLFYHQDSLTIRIFSFCFDLHRNVTLKFANVVAKWKYTLHFSEHMKEFVAKKLLLLRRSKEQNEVSRKKEQTILLTMKCEKTYFQDCPRFFLFCWKRKCNKSQYSMLKWHETCSLFIVWQHRYIEMVEMVVLSLSECGVNNAAQSFRTNENRHLR